MESSPRKEYKKSSIKVNQVPMTNFSNTEKILNQIKNPTSKPELKKALQISKCNNSCLQNNISELKTELNYMKYKANCRESKMNDLLDSERRSSREAERIRVQLEREREMFKTKEEKKRDELKEKRKNNEFDPKSIIQHILATEDAYQILGIKKSLTDEAKIQLKWKKLVVLIHPQKNVSNSSIVVVVRIYLILYTWYIEFLLLYLYHMNILCQVGIDTTDNLAKAQQKLNSARDTVIDKLLKRKKL